LNGRTALVNTVLPVSSGKDIKQPVAIAKGEQMVYGAFVLHRRKDIWGRRVMNSGLGNRRVGGWTGGF
jgi:hypothetical protein